MAAPLVEFFEFDTAQTDPTGNRHVEGGSFAFKQRVSLGCEDYSTPGTSGTLDFPNLKYSQSAPTSDATSDVVAVVVHKFTDPGVYITNMRLFLRDDSVFQAGQDQGLDRGYVQFTSSGVWQQNPVLPSGAGARLPVGFPELPNVVQQDGLQAITGEGDLNVSRFIYMNIVIPVGTPLGSYGVCGSGLLRFGFTFDFYPV